MKTYALNEELSDYDFAYVEGLNLKWLVYHYTQGYYDGDGEAVGFDGEKLYIFNLSHCSCHGPLDGQAPTVINVEDVLNENVLSDLPESCETKVCELLKGN